MQGIASLNAHVHLSCPRAVFASSLLQDVEENGTATYMDGKFLEADAPSKKDKSKQKKDVEVCCTEQNVAMLSQHIQVRHPMGIRLTLTAQRCRPDANDGC